MPASNKTMIRKLQIAINNKGYKLLLDRSQFYSDSQNRPITMYKISQAIADGSGRNKKQKLFDSTSQIQIVLFLRDFWYWINDWEIPQDNEMWNKIKLQRNIVFQDKDG